MAKDLPNHLSLSTNPQTGKDEYYCVPCKRTFFSRTQKYYHYNCNNNDKKKHKCGQCEQSFSTRSHLNYHLESHRAATYNCVDCGKTFSNRLVFEKHTKLHQRSTLFDCTVCQKTFRNKETLTAHKARHENLLKFDCSECAKKYATKSALEQHKLKHSVKKHKCPHCGKHFQRNSILNVHLKRHNQNEFFVCTTCFKKFSDAGALQRHSRTHNEENKYKCNECSLTTLRKDNMLRHIRNMHAGKTFKNCVTMLKTGMSLLDVNHKDDVLDSASIECTDYNLPKTVANSSVIKFIGNVEPVIVEPQETAKSQIKESSNQMSERTFTDLEPVKIVAEKKKYDPIEMYRKILNPDEQDELPDDNMGDQIETPDECEPVIVKRCTNSAASNSNTVHWRKHFKHTYTQHQGY